MRFDHLRRVLPVIVAAGLLLGGLLSALEAFAGPLTTAATNRDATYVPASITGSVSDASGNPITSGDICVVAYSADGKSGYETATTDASGNYALTALAPDSYYVRASDCSGSTRNDAPTVYGTQPDGTPVTVTSGQTQAGTDIKMTAGASISGMLTDAAGSPITSSDVCVEASSDTGPGYGSAISTASGAYTISQLPAGNYFIYAYDCQGSSRNDLPTYYGQSSTRPGGTTLTVTTGGSRPGADIQMQQGTSISGHVYGGSGSSSPLSGACVTASDSSSGDQFYANASGSDGSYVIHGVPSGSAYDVEFDPCSAGPQYLSQWYDGASSEAAATAVTPTATAPATNIDGHLPVGGTITGTITDSNGNPITTSDICVEADSANGGPGYGSATSTSSGSYTIVGLPSDSYEIYAYDCDGSSRNDLPTYYSTSADGSPTSVGVSLGQTVTAIDVKMSPATSISGHVYGGSGNTTPLSGACVTILNAATSNVEGSARTAADGSYTVTRLNPGDAENIEFTPCGAGSSWLLSYYDSSSTLSGATAVTPTLAAPATGIDGHLPPAGSISGQITDAAGQPILTQDVCISAGLTTGGLTRYATTDASGGYTVSGLAPGAYYVKAYDCRTSTRDDLPTYYSASSGTTRTAVSASSGTTTSGIDIQMVQGTSISGHVYGGTATTNPLSGACVYVTRVSSGRSAGGATTAADGSYSVHRLVPGTSYRVEFDPCDPSSQYSPEYYDGASTPATATAVTPTATAPATNIDGYLPVGGSITGTIADSNGSPITTSDICVEATSADGGPGYGSSSTDSSGSYTITGLAPDKYDVYAYDCYGSTRNDLPTYYSTSADGSPTAVAVSSGQTVSTIDVKMSPATSISGHVYGGAGTGTPLSDACVFVSYVSSGDWAGSANTAADGSYTVNGLTPGTAYSVEFDPCSAGRQYLSQWYDGASSEAAATAVTPTATAPATNIDGHLPVGGTITGTITDSNGNPITTSDICVEADSANGGPGYGSSSTDSSGSYTITGLAPDSYDIYAYDCNGSSRNDVPTYYNAAGGGSPTAVAVSSGQTVSAIDVQMSPGTSISGHVYGTSDTSTPVSGVCVTAYQATSEQPAGSAQTSKDGSYTITGIPADAGYQVEFDPCGRGSQYAVQYYKAQSSLSAADVITPSAANPSQGIDAHLTVGASISGSVTDSNGNPITTSDICVEAASVDGSGYGYATTTPSGSYTITGLAAGSYDVQFSDCPTSGRNDVTQYYGGASDASSSSLVVLSDGGAQTGVDAQMQPGTAISGHAYAGSGTATPLSGICVSVNPESATGGNYYYGQTDSTGAYTIQHIAPVSAGYTVEFTDCNSTPKYVSQFYGGTYDPASGTAVTPTVGTPAAGIDAHLDLGGSITGTVTDNSGAPITSGVCATAQMTGPGSYEGWTYSLTSAGLYTIGALPSGDYSVSFDNCDGTRNDLSQTLPNPVSVNVGQTTTGVDVSMSPATSISGHVYGGPGTGTPLAGVCVDARDQASGNYVGQGYTGMDGSYEIKHLSPGSNYVVQFNTCPSGTSQAYATQYYDGVSSIDQAAALTPTLATPSTGIDAHLPDGAPVTTITGGPANKAQSNQTDASFAFVANQAGATFECALDGGAYAPCMSPYDTGTLASGTHTFSVRASANGLTEVNPTYVQWTINPSSPTSTSQGEVTAGGTFSSDPGNQTSSTTPVIVDVTPPASSQVTLTTEPTTTASGNGYTVFGQQVDISVAQPDGSGAVTGTQADPIEIAFTLDQSEIPPNTNINDITVTRNGTVAANCNAQDGTATPDPCVESRTTLVNGSVQIVVLTTHASTWNFAATSSVAAPVNTSAPAAPTGTPQQGQTLTAAEGSWSNTPTSYSYQWERCDSSGGSCSQISGATSKTYLLASADVGHTIRVLVSATNSGGTSASSARSAATTVILPLALPAPVARVSRVTVKGTTATVVIACVGTGGQSCGVNLDLTAIERLKGKNIVAVIAGSQKAVTLGVRSVTISGGSTSTETIALNRAGKHLLKRLKHMQVKLTVTQTGTNAHPYTKTLRFRSSKK